MSALSIYLILFKLFNDIITQKMQIIQFVASTSFFPEVDDVWNIL